MVGESATFAASDLYFFGVRMSKVDLGLLLGEGEEFYCQLDMLEVKEGPAQYRVKLGWINRGPGTLRPTGQLKPDTAALHRHLLKLALTYPSAERMAQGRAPLQCSAAPDKFAVGKVCQLESPGNNETVSRGKIKICCGSNKGAVIKFSRSKALLFGQSLAEADLLYVVRPGEPVVCEVAGLADYGEGEYVSQSVHLWKHSEVEQGAAPLSWQEQERQDLLHWLSVHNLSYRELKEVFAGTSPPRYFIPFPRDPLVGRVVCFDPPNARFTKYGCTSGTIVVESGALNTNQEDEPKVKDMKGVEVTFHRSCFWVYGRKISKGDLSYLVQPNERVTLECRAITEEDRRQHASLPQDIHYRHSLVLCSLSNLILYN